MKIRWLSLAVIAWTVACSQEAAPAPSKRGAEVAPQSALTVSAEQIARFQPPLPDAFEDEAHPLTTARVELGRKLFFDARFSKNHDVSCNTCHTLDAYGVDGLPTSKGHKGAIGRRNSPTVFNAAGHFAQFWDGRAASVEEQATGPVMNPVEMAMPSPERVLATLRSMPEYVQAFHTAFPARDEPVSLESFALAIGAFERRLTTPAPWDDFLRGDPSTLTDAQKRGFETFVEVGCSACHQGTLVGGSMYQKAGLIEAWPNDEDEGRFEVTRNAGDSMMFKVPSLRNITETAPYFHDGSEPSLTAAIRTMGSTQLGKTLSDDQVKSIREFLGALTGEIPRALVAPPRLPPSTQETPKPDPT